MSAYMESHYIRVWGVANRKKLTAQPQNIFSSENDGDTQLQ